MKTCLMLVAGLLVVGNVVADDAKIKKAIEERTKFVLEVAAHKTVIEAVKEQNKENLAMDVITKRDEEWKAAKELTAFQKELQGRKVAKFLKSKVKKNKTIYNEAFLTDNKGANVACFPETGDYWQGDEGKFTKCYKDGNGEVFVGPVELDESTGVQAVQVSAPVKDESGKTIGVLVMGVKLSFADR